MAECAGSGRWLAVLRRSAAAVRDIWVGASGADDYRSYLRHLRAHHPAATPLSAERFARERLNERWDGVRRCC